MVFFAAEWYDGIITNRKGAIIMKLGETIYRLRTEKRLSQEELAERLDVSRQSISKWETDAAVPELDKLVKLSELFGVTLDALVHGLPPIEKSVPDENEEEISILHNEKQKEYGKGEVVVSHRIEFPIRKIVGILFFFLGILTFMILLVGVGGFSSDSIENDLIVMLKVILPMFICGTICLTAKRRAALWCAWVYLIWWDLILTLPGRYDLLYYFKVPFDSSFQNIYNWAYILWAITFILLLTGLVVWTIFSFRKNHLALSVRGWCGLGGGWAAWLGFSIFRHTNILENLIVGKFEDNYEWIEGNHYRVIDSAKLSRNIGRYNSLQAFFFWLSVIALAVLLVLTVTAIRTKRQEIAARREETASSSAAPAETE